MTDFPNRITLLHFLLRVQWSSLTWPHCCRRRDSGNPFMDSTLKTSSMTRKSLLNQRPSCLSLQVREHKKQTYRSCCIAAEITCTHKMGLINDFEILFVSQVPVCVSERVWLVWSSSSSRWLCWGSLSSSGLRMQGNQTTLQSMGSLWLPNLIAWRSNSGKGSKVVCRDSGDEPS